MGQPVRNTVTYSSLKGLCAVIVYGEGERYVVSVVDGWNIAPSGERGHRQRSTVILDSHDCYREVLRISSRGPNGHPRGSVKQASIAGNRCDRLNAEHARAVLLTEPPADFDFDAEYAALKQRRLDVILWERDRNHRSVREIADRLGITVQYVNQLLREANGRVA